MDKTTVIRKYEITHSVDDECTEEETDFIE